MTALREEVECGGGVSGGDVRPAVEAAKNVGRPAKDLKKTIETKS